MFEILCSRLGDRLSENEPLRKHTNFRIGGPARYFFEATSSDAMIAAVTIASELKMPFFILGGGSNVLVSDEGFLGLVIKSANRGIKIEDTRVVAEAGALSAFVARKSAEIGLTGLEWMISLPGTIGGAVRGNAGCFGGETREHLTEVSVLQFDDEVWSRNTFRNDDCKFGYRDSIFKHLNHQPIILDATFSLSIDDAALCMQRTNETLSKRRQAQPLESASAGCMFKNFTFTDEKEVQRLESDTKVPEEFMRAKKIPAGWIVEHLDFKGVTIGDISVSEKHANFLQNKGSGTASDVVQLVSLIKMKARDRFGIQLHEEVQYVGF